jgi:DNA (cytosine-5)-methyltransferase 1
MKSFAAVSVFSGAGGLDIGMERSGFRTVALCELDPNFAETLRANQGAQRGDGVSHFAEAVVHQTDVRGLSGRDLAAGAEIDCLLGGPPCQAFSSSGKQLSVLDPRGSLVEEFVRLTREIGPKTFVFENVRARRARRARRRRATAVP